MSFIDTGALGGGWDWIFELVTLFFGGIPESGIIRGGYIEILSDPTDPGRQSLNALPRSRNHRDLSDVKVNFRTRERTELTLILES